MGDSPYYINYVEYFRGKLDIKEVPLPFCYRPALPFIASYLPFKNPMTAINILNLICLFLTLLFLFRLLEILGFNFWYALLGCYLFTISFPTFYYSTVGGLDPGLMFLLTLGTYLIYRESWSYLALTLAVGSLVKESVVLLIPVCLSFLWVKQKRWKLKILFLLLAYLLPSFLIHSIFRSEGSYLWFPKIEYILGNIRIRALLGLLLSFGLPGVLSLLFFYSFRKFKKLIPKEFYLPMIVGILFSFLLALFSFLTAYLSGRFLWPMSIYSIPLSLWVIRFLFLEKIKLPQFS